MSSFRSFYDNNWPCQNFYQMHFRRIQYVGGGGGYTRSDSWILKIAQELLITNPVSPLQTLCDHTFYIYLMYPQGVAYNPCCEGPGGGAFILNDIIFEPFIYVEKNGPLKILIRCVSENGGPGRGLIALQSLWILKRALALSISNRMNLFSKFLRQKKAISKFLSDSFWENTRWVGGIHPSITLNPKRALKILIGNPINPLQSLLDYLSIYILYIKI